MIDYKVVAAAIAWSYEGGEDPSAYAVDHVEEVDMDTYQILHEPDGGLLTMANKLALIQYAVNSAAEEGDGASSSRDFGRGCAFFAKAIKEML